MSAVRISMNERAFRLGLLVIVGLAILLRAAVMARGDAAFDDPDNYLPLARSIAAGGGFAHKGKPTAYRPPLYPLILAPVVKLAEADSRLSIAIPHLALGAGAVIMTAVAAMGFGLSRQRALLAAFVTACDPVLVSQSRSVMTETPAAFLVALALAGLSRPGYSGALLGGLGFGLAGLCRPSILACAALVIVALLVSRPAPLMTRIARCLTLLGTLMLVLAPWTLRNLAIFGEPIATTTHGGYTLALANNPVYYRQVLNGPAGAVWSGDEQWQWWDSVNTSTAGMSEPDADRYLARAAWRLAREQPVDFLRAGCARLGRFWGVAPASAIYSTTIRWLTILWTVPLWILLAAGALTANAWRWPRVTALATVVGLMCVHAVFWTDMRMRAPIVPAIAIIAAGAVRPRWLQFPRTSTGVRNDQ
jgi:4-amino-4-deoxy-L-arabinose transferase-like glycosyltransferase